jgi:hypothetical protein
MFMEWEGYADYFRKGHGVPTRWLLVSDIEHSAQLPE